MDQVEKSVEAFDLSGLSVMGKRFGTEPRPRLLTSNALFLSPNAAPSPSAMFDYDFE